MFDRAFRMFAEAFEKRADEIYGAHGPQALSSPSACRTQFKRRLDALARG